MLSHSRNSIRKTVQFAKLNSQKCSIRKRKITQFANAKLNSQHSIRKTRLLDLLNSIRKIKTHFAKLISQNTICKTTHFANVKLNTQFAIRKTSQFAKSLS